MGKSIIYMVLSTIVLFTGPGMVSAQDGKATAPLALTEDPPSRYVVVKGDTLWDISARFLRDPWRWPDIWHVNPQIKNPHLIYPGDRVELTFKDGKPQLVLKRAKKHFAGLFETISSGLCIFDEPVQKAISLRPSSTPRRRSTFTASSTTRTAAPPKV